MPLQYKKYWLITITLTVLLAFSFQGSRGLWEPDEGRYVRCAYEMVQSGDWLTPRLNNTPHFAKPPLTYWFIASGLSVFGMNEWGARFFHAIAFIATALMAAYLAANMWDRLTGLLSALVYVSMVIPYIAANIVTTDMILTCFETGAMLSFWMCFVKQHDHPRHAALWGALMGLFLGLAFLTKGPPGLLPALAGAAYLALSLQKRKAYYPPLFLGILAFSVIALPWYLLVILKYDGLLSYFINSEFIGRIFTGEHSRNSGLFGAFKIYPHTLFLGALPWSCFWLLWGWKNRSAMVTLRWWKQLRQRDNCAVYCRLVSAAPIHICCCKLASSPVCASPFCSPCPCNRSVPSAALSWAAASLALLRGKPAVYLMVFLSLLISSRAIAAHLEHKKRQPFYLAANKPGHTRGYRRPAVCAVNSRS